MSGFRLRAPVVRLVEEKLRQPIPPAGQSADAEKPSLSGVVSDHHRSATVADSAASDVVGPNEETRTEYPDVPAPYAWAGKLICILTAATTGVCLLLAIV
jgi:hypothetical protein